MFFQYNPNGAFWGSMHWAHATSPDMIHWKHEPLALAPTPADGIAMVCSAAVPCSTATTPTVIYTGVLPPASPAEITLDDGQSQVARSAVPGDLERSGSAHLEKLPEPIIAASAGHRRSQDSAIRAYGGKAKTGCSRSDRASRVKAERCCSTSRGSAALDLPASADRRPRHGAAGGQSRGQRRDVGVPGFLPAGRPACAAVRHHGQGVVEDRHVSRAGDSLAEKEGVVDLGSYYAAKTMLDEHGNRILWGWIPETRPESEYRAAGWAGVMALPRVLSLGSDRDLRMNGGSGGGESCGRRMRRSKARIAIERRRLPGMRIHDLAGEIESTVRGEARLPSAVALGEGRTVRGDRLRPAAERMPS